MNDTRQQLVVLACTDTVNGCSTLCYSLVSVNQADIDCGKHRELAIKDAKERGYKEPFITFDESQHHIITGTAEGLKDFQGCDPSDPKLAIIVNCGHIRQVICHQPLKALVVDECDEKGGESVSLIAASCKPKDIMDMDALFDRWNDQVFPLKTTKH